MTIDRIVMMFAGIVVLAPLHHEALAGFRQIGHDESERHGFFDLGLFPGEWRLSWGRSRTPWPPWWIRDVTIALRRIDLPRSRT